jgi:uncharacterized membrane protein
MTLYNILVFIHIFSAILGMGPGLVMTFVVTGSNPTTMSELRQSFKIRNTLHIFTMVGGILLLLTGLFMGFLRPFWFTQGWYLTSLTLYLIALAMGPFVLKPRSTPIKKMIAESESEEIPEKYQALSKDLFFYENITNVLFLVIIALMILKPF